MRSDSIPLLPPSLLFFAVNPASVINLIVTASIFSPSLFCTLGEVWKASKLNMSMQVAEFTLYVKALFSTEYKNSV